MSTEYAGGKIYRPSRMLTELNEEGTFDSGRDFSVSHSNPNQTTQSLDYEMENIKSEYLNYIRLMYDRESNKGKQSGITKWGVVIGVVYISWHFIDAFSGIASNPLALHLAVFMYGLIYLSIDSFSDFFRSHTSLRKTSKFNLRIRGNSAWNMENNIPLLFLVFVLPIISFLGRDEFIYEKLGWPPIGAFIEAQAMINLYYLSFTFIAVASFIVVSLYYEKMKGFPTPISIIAHTKGDSPFIFLKALSIEIALGNAIAAYLILTCVSQSTLKPILICSFDAALIAIALIYLSNQRAQSSRIEQILSLERDVVFHDLSDEDIKFRIQEEFIGHEFGDWLNNKVSEIRVESSKLIESAEAAISESAEIIALPESLIYERSGRVSKLLDNLESGFNCYKSKVGPLLDWMRPIADSSGTYDKHIVETIFKIFGELKKINEDTHAKMQEAMQTLRTIVRSQGQHRN